MCERRTCLRRLSAVKTKLPSFDQPTISIQSTGGLLPEVDASASSCESSDGASTRTRTFPLSGRPSHSQMRAVPSREPLSSALPRGEK